MVKMNVFSPIRPLVLGFLRAVAFVVIFLSGLLTVFLSQASATDYRALHWDILPIALFHSLIAGLYFWKVRHWTRWGALVLAIFALGSFGEMTVRVWF